MQHIGVWSGIDGNDAQCIIAVCGNVKKHEIAEDRLLHVMTEMYKNAFLRHNEYRALLYRQNTSLIKRIFNKLKMIYSKYRHGLGG